MFIYSLNRFQFFHSPLKVACYGLKGKKVIFNSVPEQIEVYIVALLIFEALHNESKATIDCIENGGCKQKEIVLCKS